MTLLGISSAVVTYNVSAATLSGKIVSSDQLAKSFKEAEKAAKESKVKADEAQKKADDAEQNATSSGKPGDRKKAETAKEKANTLKANADDLARKLSALSITNSGDSSSVAELVKNPDTSKPADMDAAE